MADSKPKLKLQTYGWALHGAGIAAVVACAVAAELLVYAPIAAESEELTNQSDEYAAFLQNGDAIRTRHADLSARLLDKETKLTQLYKQIPDTARESDFLEQLSKLANDGELVIHKYRPRAPVTQERHSEMEIELSAQGGYEGICKFLNGLGELPRVCRVSTLQISVPSSGSVDYTIELTLRIYFASAKKRGEQDA